MEEGNSDDDSRTELEDINGRKGLIGGKEDHQEDEDMDSDEEDLEREDENLQGMKDVIVVGEAETASAVTFSRYYSEAHARRLLKADVVDNERMLMTYVVHVVFKDMKFTLGDEEEEMALCQMGIGEKYITIKDPKIPESAFVSEYYSLISKNVTHLRTRAISAARKKFIRKCRLCLFLGCESNLTVMSFTCGTGRLELDEKEADEEDRVLPDDLGKVLLSGTYRNYLAADGEIRDGREQDYKVYKWFVSNILPCINYEHTNIAAQNVRENGYHDFITRVYTESDEAFAVLMVSNYEQRWRNQHQHPTRDKRLLKRDPLYATKYTSSVRGYCKLPWSSTGIKVFNDQISKIGKLRAAQRTGIQLEARILKEVSVGKIRRKRRTREVIETRPVVGGALRRKLQSFRNG